MTRTFVDRGGTFTDVVVVEDAPTRRVEVRKVPSDRAIVGELARGALVPGARPGRLLVRYPPESVARGPRPRVGDVGPPMRGLTRRSG